MGGGGVAAPLAVVASKDGKRSSGSIDPSVLAQLSGAAATSEGAAGHSQPVGYGPGGLGGGSMADFDSLIELITSTVSPDSWDDVGGPGSIAPFETNLSLVIRQTEEVHEEIVDLLEQLRRLQDLQVTIEVRFITLNDNFFERIGVDFDFDINDKIDRPFQVFGRPDPTASTAYTTNFTANSGPARDVQDRDYERSVTVGLSAPNVFSADLDIPFRQGSFDLAVPQFGGFDATAGASLGFAILSDIEAFFFINAAQGDRRSNVLQAPKVTLFNGQVAFVSDTSQSPFVISVIPVVGDFAAAQQPVIVVLSEGTFLTVQAVVSNDRRFVRLTVVPFFSRIGDVRTFTFTGTETTTDNSSTEGIQDKPNDNTKKSSQKTTTHEGTTVQLPTFSFVTVTTTVSVPDGGTVLLGGIKRLSEGRNEFGVPLLNKLPYVNRLFKNVGIGRETQSLMMMVTPRIIIEEEEEERLGVVPP
jgi:general secretion pathway protein D